MSETEVDGSESLSWTSIRTISETDGSVSLSWPRIRCCGSVSVSWPSIRATVMQLDDLELIMEEMEMVIEQLREVNMSSKRQLRQLRNHNKYSNLPAKYFRLSQRLKTLTAHLRAHVTRSHVKAAMNSIARRIAPYLLVLNRRRESKRKIEFWTGKLEDHRISWQFWTEKLMKDIPLLNLQQKPVEITCWEDVLGLMRVTELDTGKALFFHGGARRRVGSKWHKFSISNAHIRWFGVDPRKAVRKLVGGNLSIANEDECTGAGSRYMGDRDYWIAGVEMACIPVNAQRLRYKEKEHLDEEWCRKMIPRSLSVCECKHKH